MFNNDQPQ